MKKCINCGKEFEPTDGRIKKCDSCRKDVKYHTPSKEEFEKVLAESTDRVQKHMKKLRRINLLKTLFVLAYDLTILFLLVIILLIVAK